MKTSYFNIRIVFDFPDENQLVPAHALYTFSYYLTWYPQEALQGAELACAQADTLRLKLLKIGARILQTSRKKWVHMASGYIYKELLSHAVQGIRLASG